MRKLGGVYKKTRKERKVRAVLGTTMSQWEIALLLQWKTNSFVDSFDNTRFNGEG